MKFKPFQIAGAALIGAAALGGYVAWRTTDWSSDPLENFGTPRPLNWIGNCEDLIPLYMKIRNEFLVCLPDHLKATFNNQINESIKEVDQMMCIQLQLENHEITPSQKDIDDATYWYTSALSPLRMIQSHFVNKDKNSQLSLEFTKLLAEISKILIRHLTSITSIVREYSLTQVMQSFESRESLQSASEEAY